MCSAFLSVGHLADHVQSQIGPTNSRDLADSVARQMWNRGVRCMDDFCVDDEFFEFAKRLDG